MVQERKSIVAVQERDSVAVQGIRTAHAQQGPAWTSCSQEAAWSRRVAAVALRLAERCFHEQRRRGG